MNARDIMTRDPEVATPGEPLCHVAALMERMDVGAIPIVEDRTTMRLRGIITDRDIAVRHVARGHLADCAVSQHMTREPLEVVRPDESVEEVLQRMKAAKVRRIPVVEDGQRLVGIIAQADLAVRFGPEEPEELEEALAAISEPARPWRPAREWVPTHGAV